MSRVAGGLAGVLLTASIVPGVACADVSVAAAAPPPAAGPAPGHATGSATGPGGGSGGASMATATALTNELDYSGTIVPGHDAWYSFQAAGGLRALATVRSPAGSCQASVALIDAQGTTLAQVITSTRERLPLIAFFPHGETSSTYYVKVGADPFARCASAGYALALAEPDQPTPCNTMVPTPTPTPGQAPEPVMETCPTRESVPAFAARACVANKRTFERVREQVLKEAALVARRHGSRAALGRLQSEERTDHRRMNVSCNV